MVYTDHKPLEKFNIKNCNDPELRQILNYLSPFDFEIIYNPGKNNLEADCSSRNPVLEEENKEDEKSIVKIANFLKLEEIINNQKQLKLNDNYTTENDIIYKTLNNRKKIWLTEEFGIDLIESVHIKQGHIGTKQLTLAVTHKFYFKNMHKHIKMICRSCDTCIKNKTRIGNFKAPLSQLGPALEPFKLWH